MTTHGDAVGPSAIPAASAAPALDDDAEQPAAAEPQRLGGHDAATGTSPTADVRSTEPGPRSEGTVTLVAADPQQTPARGTAVASADESAVAVSGARDQPTDPPPADDATAAAAPTAADAGDGAPRAYVPPKADAAPAGDVAPEADVAPRAGATPAAEAAPEAGASPEAGATPESGATPEPGAATEAVGVQEEATVAAPQDPAAAGSATAGQRTVGQLGAALAGLRSEIDATTYPLVMPSAENAKRVGAAVVAQLDDYLLPRLARLDAPLLVVVGGSTGAGKSTLVNSLVRAPVTTAGVLRPTTRSPVLVSHPSDSQWFRTGDLLPGMTRTTEPSNDSRTLQLVAAPALGPGLAFLDAPDIDSVVDANRALAAQLLAAADLWLFVTTAARYADAVPWELLRTARQRGTVIALVLDRVPPEAAGDISAHLSEMLATHDMAAAPLFVLPETALDGQGLLAESIIRPLHDWFAQLAADAGARSAVVRQTLDGALSALSPAVASLAAAADDQAVAARALDERVRAAYRNGRRTVEEGLRDGRLLRGEVLARWQEFIGTGDFLRGLESRVGHLRDRLVSAVTGRPAPGRNLQVALESQLITLMRGVGADAAEQAYQGWQAHPAGAALLEPSLGRASDDLPERAERMVRDWQRNVLDLVRTEAADKRFVARSAAYAVNATGLAVMIAVFTSTAFIPTGAELAVGAGTTVAAQKVLEAIFGDQAIRTLAARARADLLDRVDELLAQEAARYAARIEVTGLEAEPGAALRKAADLVERAREELALTAGPSAALPSSGVGT